MGHEALTPYPRVEKRRRNHPTLAEIGEQLGDRVDTARHELAHALTALSLGVAIKEVSVIPGDGYLGITRLAGNPSLKHLQAIAMASHNHSGNGSDRFKAERIQEYTGNSIDSAKTTAENALVGYRKKVLDAAAQFLAYYGRVGEGGLRSILQWAEEEVNEREEYQGMSFTLGTIEAHLPTQSTDIPEETILRLLPSGDTEVILPSGEQYILCRFCGTKDIHQTDCPTLLEQELSRPRKPLSQTAVIWQRDKS